MCLNGMRFEVFGPKSSSLMEHHRAFAVRLVLNFPSIGSNQSNTPLEDSENSKEGYRLA